jgi:segregation and condensation protein B
MTEDVATEPLFDPAQPTAPAEAVADAPVMADAPAPVEPVAGAAPVAATEPAQEDAALSLASQVEALLYASGEPASLAALAGALDATNGEIEAALEELTALYAVRGIRLQRSGNKVQLVTAPEIASKVQKFLGLEEVNKLSPAALETLAIIAYNQPITRPQMEMIRGVNCDGVITTLMARNLVQELGRADTVGHPMRYGVSFEFLQYFGLRNVHELPPVEKLDTLPVEKGEPAETVAEEATTDAQPPEAVLEGVSETVEAAAEEDVLWVEASAAADTADADADERHPVEQDGPQ